MSIEQELKEIERIKQELLKVSENNINDIVAFVLSERIDECLSGNSPREGRVTFLERCRDRALRDASPTLDMNTKKEEPKVEVMFFATGFEMTCGKSSIFGRLSDILTLPKNQILTQFRDWCLKLADEKEKEVGDYAFTNVKIIKL